MGRKIRHWRAALERKSLKKQERQINNPSISELVAYANWETNFVWCRR